MLDLLTRSLFRCCSFVSVSLLATVMLTQWPKVTSSRKKRRDVNYTNNSQCKLETCRLPTAHMRRKLVCRDWRSGAGGPFGMLQQNIWRRASPRKRETRGGVILVADSKRHQGHEAKLSNYRPPRVEPCRNIAAGDNANYCILGEKA